MLMCSDYYSRSTPIIFNVDQIVSVSAVVFTLSVNIIDCYLVTCENLDVRLIIIRDHMNLLDAENDNEVSKLLIIYRNFV